MTKNRVLGISKTANFEKLLNQTHCSCPAAPSPAHKVSVAPRGCRGLRKRLEEADLPACVVYGLEVAVSGIVRAQRQQVNRLASASMN